MERFVSGRASTGPAPPGMRKTTGPAFGVYLRLAMEGSIVAQRHVALMHDFGEGVPVVPCSGRALVSHGRGAG